MPTVALAVSMLSLAHPGTHLSVMRDIAHDAQDKAGQLLGCGGVVSVRTREHRLCLTARGSAPAGQAAELAEQIAIEVSAMTGGGVAWLVDGVGAVPHTLAPAQACGQPAPGNDEFYAALFPAAAA